jgi:2-polyprenyl-6-methoxyphenol hydroxylase-like FAD-dependent oxidoreductase
MAGLATARVLGDHFDAVTVVDRDTMPDEVASRKGAPQGRHAHALLGGGARAIETLFPGVIEELHKHGATDLQFNNGIWFQAGGYRAPILFDRNVVGASRPFIEEHLRRRVRALPNVTIDRAGVDSLVYDGERVRGVRMRKDGIDRTLLADLVVDCSGRGSRAPQWLDEIGFPAPEVDEVRCDVRYATVVLRRTPGDTDAQFAVIIGTPPHEKYAAFLLPIEHDRWICTIAGTMGAEAPQDATSFHARANALPSPEIARLLERAEMLTPVINHRLPTSRRHRYEKIRRHPVGFVALGDAICSFNPIYGQGMSSAVLQAVALGETLRGPGDRIEHAFYKRASKVIENPWRIAVGADFAYPECAGPKPLGTDLVNRYMARVLLAARVSPEVNSAMILVQNLLAPPSILFKPAMVRKVLRASRAVAQSKPRDAVATRATGVAA